jgi:protocatechuate 3,4-dioxygenase beta subunit
MTMPPPCTDRPAARRPGHQTSNPGRRRVALAAAAACAAVVCPALASSRRVVAAMGDGPFYPPRAWREQWTDWDADLSRVQRDGRSLVARGEHLGLELQLADTNGRAVDAAEVEIWQCDALAVYHHPRVRMVAGQYDPAFQGFGASRSDGDGRVRFRSIKPVPYPGRTPHIHVKLRHASFGELSSQLFIADDPGNARDFLWRALDEADRTMLQLTLQPAAADSGLRWQARQRLVLPA